MNSTDTANALQRFYGPNAGYVLELYDRFQQDPDSVDPATRAFFEHWTPESLNGHAYVGTAIASRPAAVDVAKTVGAANLAQAIRQRGHRAARLDPLGSEPAGDPSLTPEAHGLSEADLATLPAEVVGGPVALGAADAAEAIARLRAIYCGTTGYDFGHVQDAEERGWLLDAVESGQYRPAMSAEEQRALLRRLTDVEAFEHFLQRAFFGQHRFSIEGTDMLVPMLDAMISGAVAAGSAEVIIGQAHRGRLNVLAHVLGKPYAKIIAEFMGVAHREAISRGDGGTGGWTGDVKYHMGARRPAGEIPLKITMASNPSHLEFINPAVAGMTRAAQEDRGQAGSPRQNVDACLSITLHGDAAFPGEGIAAETLNLSRLPGYQIGGTLHLITNNQIGFTTEPWQGRSTFYASDLARGYEIPVVHVNADDPVACVDVARLAFAYRQRFHKDFMIDLIGYRRWGHNEGEEPAFTQPLMYANIRSHPTVRTLWAQALDRAGVVPKAESDQMEQAALQHLQQIREAVAGGDVPDETISPDGTEEAVGQVETAVPLDELLRLNREVYTLPDDFHLNPKLTRQIQRRIDAIDQGQPLDWGHAETLALASIVADGTPIRLAGQDTEPGTFSQRHLVFHDVENGARVTPLQRLPSAHASFAVYDSPLSEAAALGFEYGYSVEAPSALVLWEAQYGDFANGAQVIIDQFIASARVKWQENPALVLLLPHAYEGQGPEHSSARLERFLQLAADDNLRIANCSNAANYFHLLRRHAKLLGRVPRPLVVLTPKSLLRQAAAASQAEDLATGHFQKVIDDAAAAERRDEISRLILCSGKVYVDLIGSKPESDGDEEARRHVAIARVELLYPFPEAELREVLRGYPNLREIVWLQEEPRNMGAWSFLAPRLRRLAGEGQELRYIGRPELASPAEGLREAHNREQSRIVSDAFTDVPPARVAEPALKTYGVKHAD